MNRRLTKSDAIFYAAIALLAASLFVGGTLAGHRLLNRGYLWPANILFGMDADRNIRNLTEPGFNDRSNVHPFFTLFFKPVGRAVIRLGITPGTAGVIVNAAAGALAALLFAAYLRMRRLPRPESFALAFLFAASTTLVIESAVPTTFLFSLFIIIATHMLLIHSWRRRDRGPYLESTWLLAGLVNYGVTITTGFLAFVAYGFSRRDKRAWHFAFAYGLAVFALGLALTYAVGSLLNITAERQFLFGYTGPYNPFFALWHTVSSFMAWSVVAPIPQISLSNEGMQLLTFQSWHYTPLGWLFVLFWLAVLGAAFWAMLRDRNRSSRRFSTALAASLAFAIALHVFYYVSFEGNFQFAGQYQFFVIGLLAPLMARVSCWPRNRRVYFLIIIIAFSICLATRHYRLIWHAPEMVALPTPLAALHDFKGLIR